MGAWIGWLLMSMAAGAPEGFEVVRETGGCVISSRPPTNPAKAALHAACVWPTVDPVLLTALVTAPSRYPEFIWPLKQSEVRRTDGQRSLVFQQQHVWPLAPREVLLWMTPEPWQGGTKMTWTVAVEEPFAVPNGSIHVPRSDGFWAVTADPGGGARVEHQIAMDGGGKIPQWLMDSIRTKGFAQVTLAARDVALEDAAKK
jgi:hypothetical protein